MAIGNRLMVTASAHPITDLALIADGTSINVESPAEKVLDLR